MSMARIANISYQSLLAGSGARLPAAALIAAACLLPLPAHAQTDQDTELPQNGTEILELPLSGPAYAVAREAFAAYDAKDYATAIAKAREAIRQRPDVDNLKVLLLDALEASGQSEEALRQARAFIASGSSSPKITARIAQFRNEMAQQAADGVYRALEKHDYALAVRLAQEAVTLNPNEETFRYLLIMAQLRERDYAAAEQSATDALAEDQASAVAATFRAVSRLNQDKSEQAIADLERALNQDGLAETERNELRLIAVDYLIAIGDVARAEAILADYTGDRKKLESRIVQIRQNRSSGGKPVVRPGAVALVPLPSLDCREAETGSICALVASATPADAGYNAASEAYRAMSLGNYDLALAKIREAIGLAPGNPTYRTAEANILAAQKARQPSATPDEVAAGRAYELYAGRQYAAASESARNAVTLAPDNRQYRALLIDSLIGAGQTASAVREIDATFARFGTDAHLLQQRGYLMLRLNQPARAADDFARALALVRSPQERHTLQLALADAAAAAGQPLRALKALEGLGDANSYIVTSRRANLLLALDRREEALVAFRQAAATAPTAADRSQAIATMIGIYADLQQKREAREAFSSALAKDELADLPALDVAYLALRVDDARVANEKFTLAEERGQLQGLALIDAGYAARRAFDNTIAIDRFKAAIDDVGATLKPQELFGLRREVADISRTWGAYVSLSYGAAGSGAFAPQSSGGATTQTGTEIFWRPPVIGYRDGAIFDLFVRNFTTLHDERGGAVGFRTMQGSVGARWKPLRDYNFILEGARLFRIGSESRDDTMVRVAYSDGRGGDLRVDTPSWWTWQVSGELGRYFEVDQTFSTADAKIGRSFRMDAISNHLVLTPFLGVTSNFDNLLADKWAVGAGPGINARYWFREDKYAAPRSYLDLNVQYRFRLLRDDRARGLFASLTMVY